MATQTGKAEQVVALPMEKSSEPIPGYTLVERLGSGGYGEVWKAIAPGVIEKAIKFVYGYHDEERAERELKALNRIKEVRHPFLLSLDRIEVVDGQLLIVTELADQSLKDRYHACQESGSCGISRDELLVYMGDAADALDFMSERFGLQHLDVKPENLLLVGGRVKVADFGLVRDLHNVSVSLMGGLTPAYAPPEAFEGSPGFRSDQYSLAIVYQEMLSATLPFSGSTPARLMTQHINDTPDVSMLPRRDQPPIARALNKNPKERFSSCRALVDSLLAGPKASAALSQSERLSLQSRADTDRGHTVAIPSATSRGLKESQNSTINAPPVDVDTVAEAIELPTVKLNEAAIDLRPTLFLGIGGAGGKVLSRLRRRLSGRYGSMDKLPAMRMLLLDADLKAILQATVGEESAALQAQDTLAIPLRKSQEYRSDTSKLLQWLSRRWLYNIPRSLQPEGRRALGRLAFIDHAEQIIEKIDSVIGSITSPEAIELSAQTTGKRFNTVTPRIFIVASISGGTGGGIVPDVIHAVRKILADRGIADDGVCSILLHSTRGTAAAHDLAVANAYACLSELSHYGLAPHLGEFEDGSAEWVGNHRTLRETYLVAMGEHLEDDAYNQAIDRIAQYVYLCAATQAGTLLEKCRFTERSSKEPGHTSMQLRSFGLFQFGSFLTDLPTGMTDLLCRTVIQRWCDEPVELDPKSWSEETEAETKTGTEASKPRVDMPEKAKSTEDQQQVLILPAWRAYDLSLDYESLLQQLSELVIQHVAGAPTSHCRKLMEKSYQDRAGEQSGTSAVLLSEQLITSINTSLSEEAEPQEPDSPECELSGLSLDEKIQRLAATYADAVGDAVKRLVEIPGARVVAARRAVERFRASLDLLRNQACHQVEQARQRADAMAARFLAQPKLTRSIRRFRFTREDRQDVLSGHQQAIMDAILTLAAATRVEPVLHQIGIALEEAEQRLTGLLRELSNLSTRLQSDEHLSGNELDSPHNTDEQLRHWMISAIQERIFQQIDKLEQQLDDKILKPQGGVYGLFAQGGIFHERLLQLLQPAARDAAVQLVQEIDLVDGVLELGRKGEDGEGAFQSWIEAATPKLLPCARAKRQFMVAKEGNATSQLHSLVEQKTESRCSVAYDSDNDIVVCNEIEGISYQNVAAHLIGNRRRYAELASRLHTRVDVDWNPLTTLG
jgi:serine/threonine protein kinase